MFSLNDRQAISQIAARLDVPLAALLAVIEVESGGQAFAKVRGRKEPLIRFEGHYFHRFLKGQKLASAVIAGLASPLAGGVRNPRSQIKRWALLDRASDISRIAALSSTSWGVGQVMGAHWKWLRYPSVDALVAEARSGLPGQVDLMARYIEKAGLLPALRKQDWAHFARVYNGPAYRKNRYDTKMAEAFSRLQAEETHPLSSSLPTVSERAEPGTMMFGSRGPAVRTLQTKLNANGYLVAVDGFFGLVTDRIVRQFQRDFGLMASGIVGLDELMILAASNAPARQSMLASALVAKQAAQKQMQRLVNEAGSRVSGAMRTAHQRLLSIVDSLS